MRNPHTPHGASFPPTRVSIFHRAQTGDIAAKDYLYRSYIGAMLAHARRRNFAKPDAQAHSHDFLAGIIQQSMPFKWDPAKGRFRSYLLKAFNHFLSMQLRVPQKRGGGVEHLALDGQPSGVRDALAHTISSEDELRFDYNWAQGLYARAMKRLKDSQAKNQRRFELLKTCLATDDYSRSSLASGLGISVGQVYVQVSRLRRRFRDCLRAEIAESFLHTDFAETDIDDEMHYLLRVLRAGAAPQ